MFRSLAALIGSALMLSACSSGPSGAEARSLPPPDSLQFAQAREYVIGPTDTLAISVFQADQLNREVQVDAQGRIDLPLVGAVTAAGKTSRQLSAEIARSLEAKYLQSPQVTVQVKEAASQKVTVEGSVAAPGLYPITGKTTLLQAIAMARGPQRDANEKRVAIFRTVDNRRAVAVFDLTAIRKGRAEDPEVFGNDVVVVERSGMKSIVQDVAGAMPIVGVFRWF